MSLRPKSPPPAETERELTPAEQFALESQRFLAELRRELLNTRDAVREQGDHIAAIKSPWRPTTSANTLKGFSIRETTGAASAVVYFRDGADSSAPMISVVSLAAGESDRDYFGERGLSLLKGLYIDVASGSVEGAVYLGSA